MAKFVQLLGAGTLFLLLLTSNVTAQEVTYSNGPLNGSASGFSISTTGNQGFAWGDVDSSGTLDLWVPPSTIVSNAVSTFTPWASGSPSPGSFAIGAAFADFNGDGLPDLVTTTGVSSPTLWLNSAKVSFVNGTSGALASVNSATSGLIYGVAAGPIDQSNYLTIAWSGGANSPAGVRLIQYGAGGSTNIGTTASSPVIDTVHQFESWNPAFVDVNNDGYSDLFMPSFRNNLARIDTGSAAARKGCVLFLNDKSGHFVIPNSATVGTTIYSIGAGGVVSTTADTGIIVDDTVRHYSAIASTWGDFNNDGIPDLVLSAFVGDSTNLHFLQGNGDGTFKDVTAKSTIPFDGSTRALAAGDYNNDGWLDLLESGTTSSQTRLWRNNGDGTFTEETADLPTQSIQMRGIAFVDYNNDGFMDIFGSYGANFLQLTNGGGNGNHWIGFEPQGTGNNVSAIGARFAVYTKNGTMEQIRDIQANGGAGNGGGSLWANFGIGTATKVDSVVAHWPDGKVESVTNPVIDHYLIFREGHGAAYFTTHNVTFQAQLDSLISEGFNTATDSIIVNGQFNNWNGLTRMSRVGTTSLYQYSVSISSNVGDSVQFKFRAFPPSKFSSSGWDELPPTDTTNRFFIFSGSDTVLPAIRPAIQVLSQTNYALQFNGSNQYVLVPDNPSLHITSSLTIEAWVNKFSNVQWASVLTKGSNSDGQPVNNYTLHFDSLGGMIFSGSFNGVVQSSLTYPLNQWHHVAVTWDGDSVRFYIDGVLDPLSAALSGPLIPNTFGLTMGVDFPGDTEYFAGQLDEVRLWNTARTQQEIQDGMHSQLTGSEAGLVGYWRFDEGSGTVANDLSENGNNGTLINDPEWVLSGVVLPVEITAFNTSVVGTAAVLSWQTATEVNNYGFEVQRRTANNNQSSVAGWGKVGFVAGNGTSNSPHKYSFTDNVGSAGTYWYRLKQIDHNGAFTYSQEVEVQVGSAPKVFALGQNYPNPFNPTTNIQFTVPSDGKAVLKIFNTLGQEVATLFDGIATAGEYHQTTFDASRLASGIYFSRLEFDGKMLVKKMLLLK